MGDVGAGRAQAIPYSIFLIFSSSLSCDSKKPEIEKQKMEDVKRGHRRSYIEKRPFMPGISVQSAYVYAAFL